MGNIAVATYCKKEVCTLRWDNMSTKTKQKFFLAEACQISVCHTCCRTLYAKFDTMMQQSHLSKAVYQSLQLEQESKCYINQA